MSSFDPGEALRVTRDATGVLHVHHGAREIATITRTLGGGVRVAAADRAWRLAPAGKKGWRAEGDPPAELRRRRLRPKHLTLAGDRYAIGRRTVKDSEGNELLRLSKDEVNGKPAIRAEIVTAPPEPDPLAVLALTTAAAVIGVDLRPPLGSDSSGLGQQHFASGYWFGGGQTP